MPMGLYKAPTAVLHGRNPGHPGPDLACVHMPGLSVRRRHRELVDDFFSAI